MGDGRRLTHLDSRGRARMVDVADKQLTLREAQAEGQVILSKDAFRLIRLNRIAKGDVLGVARIAGIQAAKRTSEWIPLCHSIPLTSVTVALCLNPARRAALIMARASVA